jgi:hypothetical protein
MWPELLKILLEPDIFQNGKDRLMATKKMIFEQYSQSNFPVLSAAVNLLHTSQFQNARNKHSWKNVLFLIQELTASRMT